MQVSIIPCVVLIVISQCPNVSFNCCQRSYTIAGVCLVLNRETNEVPLTACDVLFHCCSNIARFFVDKVSSVSYDNVYSRKVIYSYFVDKLSLGFYDNACSRNARYTWIFKSYRMTCRDDKLFCSIRRSVLPSWNSIEITALLADKNSHTIIRIRSRCRKTTCSAYHITILINNECNRVKTGVQIICQRLS